MTTAHSSPTIVHAEDAATINTESFSLTQNAVALASDELAMVAIVGEAGLGKTFSVASAIASIERETVTIDCDVRSMLRPTLAKLVSEITGVRHDDEIRLLKETLRELLAEPPRLLVLDEAQRLTHMVLEELRSLHDDPATEFGVVFVGGHGCWKVLSRFPMLKSRIIANVQFRPLAPSEILEIVPAYHPLYRGLDPELILLINDTFAHGVFRRWFQFTKLAVRLCEKNGLRALDENVVRNVFALQGDLHA